MFLLDNYAHQSPEALGSSEILKLDLGVKVKQTRRRNKRKDAERRDRTYPSTFKVPVGGQNTVEVPQRFAMVNVGCLMRYNNH